MSTSHVAAVPAQCLSQSIRVSVPTAGRPARMTTDAHETTLVAPVDPPDAGSVAQRIHTEQFDRA
jgi:hypothetical protein